MLFGFESALNDFLSALFLWLDTFLGGLFGALAQFFGSLTPPIG